MKNNIIVAIMQPTYLPWSGYFNIIKNSDKFVFLSDVSFEKQSWQIRNKIISNNNEIYLSVPIKKYTMGTDICKIIINDSINWRKKHSLTLTQSYAKSPFKDSIIPLICEVINNRDIISLSELNITIIRDICALLNIKAPLFESSTFNFKNKRSDYLVDICKHLQADKYLSPIGSKDYLIEDNFEKKSGLSLIFQDYEPNEYKQINTTKFISHLSIIDVIANLGIDKTKEYISGE